MPSIKYEDLSPEAKARVIEQNRDINIRDSKDWYEPIIEKHLEELTNAGLINPHIDFTVANKTYDGVLITFDASHPAMLNDKIKDFPEIIVDANDQMVSYIADHSIQNPAFEVTSVKVGEYNNETSKDVKITSLIELKPIEELICEKYPEWEICSKAKTEFDSLQECGIITNLAAGKIIYGTKMNQFNEYTEFKIGNLKQEELFVQYDLWELGINDSFKEICKAAFDELFDNDEDFTETFKNNLSYTDQVWLVADFISYKKLLKEEQQKNYDFDSLIFNVDNTHIKNMPELMDDFVSIISDNFKAWLDDKAATIYGELKESYDDVTTDKSVEDTLIVNNFYNKEFDADGNLYNPNLDRKFEYLELSPAAKNTVNNRFFEIYDFMEFNKDKISELIERAKNDLGIEIEISFPEHRKQCVIDKFEINYTVARQWLLEGVEEEIVGTFNSINDVPEAQMELVNANINAMRESLSTELTKWSSQKFEDDTNELGISDFYDGTLFDVNGKEIEDVD